MPNHQMQASHDNATQDPRPNCCHFFLQHKKRFCKFTIHEASSEEYCIFHTKAAERVPCPLDPNHSVDAAELQHHLRKCTSRPPDVLPTWYRHNHNYSIPPSEPRQSSLHGLEDMNRETFFRIIDIARQLNKEVKIEVDVKSHAVMRDRISTLTQTRHAEQQASLIGLLEDRKMLDSADLFIEWGAGRAELSRYINKALCPAAGQEETAQEEVCRNDESTRRRRRRRRQHFLLIDRDGGRLKHDNRMVEDCRIAKMDQENLVHREKVDIAHIGDLDSLISTSFPTLTQPRICSVSKHLCGAATDLTLSCLLQSSSFRRRDHVGCVIALCCHHRCTWSALHPIARRILQSHGIDGEGFEVLKDLGAYYTNGIRRGMDPQSRGQHWSGLTHLEREEIGWQCKRAIDLVRVRAIKEAMPGVNVELVRYVDQCVSKEHVALIIQT